MAVVNIRINRKKIDTLPPSKKGLEGTNTSALMESNVCAIRKEKVPDVVLKARKRIKEQERRKKGVGN